jgi:hypothetical protein
MAVMTFHLIFVTLGTLLIEHPSKSVTQLSKMLPSKTALTLFCTVSICTCKGQILCVCYLWIIPCFHALAFNCATVSLLHQPR